MTIVDREEKALDIKLAVHIAVHSSIKSIDHLGELLKVLGKGSKLENIRIHRTKCSQLIKNVIAPAMLTELVKDVGEEPYSLILDESTDISVMKYLAFIIRYHSKVQNDVLNEFLGFVELERATAEAQHLATKEFLAKVGLNVKNMIGLGVDGALSLCGSENSVFTRFKAEVSLFNSGCHCLFCYYFTRVFSKYYTLLVFRFHTCNW